jgi:hypothetical protein
MIKYIIAIFLILATTAQAKISIGSSVIYAKKNDPTIKFKSNSDQLKPTSLTIGYLKKLDNITIGLYTNRLINSKLKRRATNGTNDFDYYSATRYNLFQVGYIKKNIMPTLFVADTIIKQELYYNDVKISQDKNRVYLYGAGLNVFLDKNISFNINYIAPRESIGLESGLAFGINYLF